MKPLNILIIESCNNKESKLNSFISLCGHLYNIEYTTKIDEAQNSILRKKFDLIILDMHISNNNNKLIFERVQLMANKTPILHIVNILDKSIISFLLGKGIINFLYENKLSPEIIANTIQNIIKNNTVELSLILNKKIFYDLHENFETIVFVINKKGIIKYANEAFAKLYKLNVIEINGMLIEFEIEINNNSELIIKNIDNSLRYYQITIKQTEWENEKLQLVSIIDITKSKIYNTQKILENRILEIFNSAENLNYCISEVIYFLQKKINLESVAIRLRNGKKYDFTSSTGYNSDFIKNGHNLCNCFLSDNFIYDQSGSPIPECLCSLALLSNSYKCNINITLNGSYWSNLLCQRVFINNLETNKFINTCKIRIEGYNSIALIPIRFENYVIGILQLNDKNENMLSEKLIEQLEHICNFLGKIIQQKINEDKISMSTRKKERNFSFNSNFIQVLNNKIQPHITAFMNMLI